LNETSFKGKVIILTDTKCILTFRGTLNKFCTKMYSFCPWSLFIFPNYSWGKRGLYFPKLH